MKTRNSRRGNTQEVAHKTKNNTYRLGVSPTGVASKNENVQRNARKLSGSHPTYKGDSVPSSSRNVSMRELGAAPHGFTARAIIPQGRYAGDSGRIGFTLIELLVVVLIIGILAAVAVPQYQKAVKKAQGREVHVAIDTLDKALADYYLEHGSYEMQIGCPVTQEGLNIEIPTLKHFLYSRNSHKFLGGSTYPSSQYMLYIGLDNTNLQLASAQVPHIYVEWRDGRLQSALCHPEEICRKYFEGEKIEIQTGSSPITEFHLRTPAQD